MAPWISDLLRITAALALVLINGFFVAAEFAIIKIRPSRVDLLVEERRPFAGTLQWLVQRLDSSLSACQLGITMASLGLGWIGEPAIAHLIKPVFVSMGIQSLNVLHTVSFIIAFSLITAVHLVVGEQAPKIWALRRPELLGLWCAAPLKVFFFMSYPFLKGLNWASSLLLGLLGMGKADHGETHHTEEEIRALLEQARMYGELTHSEHRLLNAVFEFDDLLARQIMVPRGEIIFFDLEHPWKENLELAKRTKHTRYPVCKDSLDEIVGIIHIKDLVGKETLSDEELNSIILPPQRIPETMPISRLLRQFQSTHQHLAFVVDEHGTITGMVNLANALEQIVGPVEDEFDEESEEIIPHGNLKYLVKGSISVDQVENHLKIDLGEHESDTFSGLLVEQLGRFPSIGDKIEWKEAQAEVLEIRGTQAENILIVLKQESLPENHDIK